MRTSPRLIALAAAVLCVAAAGATPMPVNNPRELMVKAIDAPDGRASGVLAGEAAAAMSAQFGTSSPVRIDVRTLTRYAQAGCRRLNVTFWQDGVMLPGASAPSRQTAEFGVDYCRDGRPPSSLRKEGAQ